jgi:hypothetical protein
LGIRIFRPRLRGDDTITHHISIFLGWNQHAKIPCNIFSWQLA